MDCVKLRLRGKGSGFREGPRQEESREPLHLCISSRFYDKYLVACNMAQELLLNVYEEYKKFAEKHRRELKIVDSNAIITNGVLQVKKNEIVTGRRTAVQQLPHTLAANPQSPPTGMNASAETQGKTMKNTKTNSPLGTMNQMSVSFVPSSMNPSNYSAFKGQVSTSSVPFVPSRM